MVVAVEVKSRISNNADITRGLFQCIKYQAVLEAMLGLEGKQKNVRTVLLLETELPDELKVVQHMLGVEVIELVAPR